MHTLYYSPGACSLAPHIVLEEIGEPYATELVSSSGPREGKGTAAPAWKAMNPKGRVPALSGVAGSIGGGENLLTEAPAILLYLARTHPSARLLPTDPAGEARCLEWTNWLSGNVHAMSYGQIWRSHRFSVDEADFAAIKAKGEENVAGQHAYIERLLADGRDWAVPGGYTIVDPYLLVFYLWGRRIGLDMTRRHPAWTDLSSRVATRPAVRRILEKEALGPIL
jgi:glutathione S-transferase